MTPPTNFDHGKYQIELAVACVKLFPELEWTGPVTLNFDDKLNPEPDLIGWRDGNPYIVIEVSNTTRSSDFGPKKAAYEFYGIPFYVVYETKTRTLWTWALNESGQYVPDPPYLKDLRDYL